MKRIILDVLLGILAVAMIGDLCFAAPNTFRYPIGLGTRQEYESPGIPRGFGVWVDDWGGRHLGEDINVNSGTRIYAIADGVVRISNERTIGGYGNCGKAGYAVVIEHTLPNGTHLTSLYGHVRNGVYNENQRAGLISNGSNVLKGQYIAQIADYWQDINGNGICSDNGDQNWDHLHFGVRKGSFVESELERFYKGYSICKQNWCEDVNYDSSGKFQGGSWISSLNIPIFFRQSIPHAGKNITDVIGNSEGSIGWYYPVANPITNEIDASGDDKGMFLNVYVQNYPGKSCTINGTNQFCDGAIVYDSLGGARSAYLVWYQQFGGYSGNGGWYKPGGPHSTELRNPITNSYWSPKDNCWRQDFQMGWLCYENRRAYDSGDVAPGVYDPWGRIFSDVRRWDAATSYAFAEAYERNGAAVNLGSVYDDGGTVFVHNWTINSSSILIQNFSGGSFGSSAIIYNPSNGNAYNIRTGFWEYYKNNSGSSLLGPPKEDEHGSSATQPCAYISCQKFEKGELYWNGNSVVAYIPDPNASGGYGTNWRPSPSPDAPAAPEGLRVQ